MTRPFATSILAFVAACSASPPGERPDATPFTCASAIVVTRYRIDTAGVPTTQDEATADAFDVIAHDGTRDNQIGRVLETATEYFSPAFRPDVPANAALAGPVDWEIETDTCTETGEIRVHVGTSAQGWPRAGGTLAGGSRIEAAHGCGALPLGTLAGGDTPGWAAADQLAVDLARGDRELTGTVGFALDASRANGTVAEAFVEFLHRTESDRTLIGQANSLFDTNGDGVVTVAEIQATALYTTGLLAEETPASEPRYRPDGDPVCPADATDFISFGLAIHATQL